MKYSNFYLFQQSLLTNILFKVYHLFSHIGHIESIQYPLNPLNLSLEGPNQILKISYAFILILRVITFKVTSLSFCDRISISTNICKLELEYFKDSYFEKLLGKGFVYRISFFSILPPRLWHEEQNASIRMLHLSKYIKCPPSFKMIWTIPR